MLHRERAQQEARNAKVLELLAAKDEAMRALEARNDELGREAARARGDLAEVASKVSVQGMGRRTRLGSGAWGRCRRVLWVVQS